MFFVRLLLAYQGRKRGKSTGFWFSSAYLKERTTPPKIRRQGLEFLGRDSRSRTCHRHVLCASTSGVPRKKEREINRFLVFFCLFEGADNATKNSSPRARIFGKGQPQPNMPPACSLCGYFWRTEEEREGSQRVPSFLLPIFPY